MHLTWEPSGESGFREYKIYAQRGSSAVDETHGELIYTGTEAARTDYLLTGLMVGGSPFITGNSDLSFRVFVLHQDGSMAGSNVLHVRTPQWDESHFTRSYTLKVEHEFKSVLPTHGIALADGTLSGLVIVNDDGVHIGGVGTYFDFDHMAFMGQKLVGVLWSTQVFVMNIHE